MARLAKRYSGAARAIVAGNIVTELRRDRNKLDDPAIRDALCDAISETMPDRLMKLLGLDLPAIRTPRPKTFAEIMTKQSKPDKPVGFQSKKPIGFVAIVSKQKDQNLSCVGFAHSAIHVSPDNAPFQDEFIRESDTEQAAVNWNNETGEFVRLSPKTKPRSAEIDRVRVAIGCAKP